MKKPCLLAVISLAWLGILAVSTALLTAFANAPGQAGSPPVRWPDSSQALRHEERPTLVMFLHPRCPCSRASVGELALLMAHCQDRVSLHVFFLRPAGSSLEWTQTDIWREVARIPGVTVHEDYDGREAKLFQVETSGDTVLYDAKGRLLFHGGITTSRGHSGDNAGRDSIQALLLNQPAQLTGTPAFGCSLFQCPAPAPQ